MEKTSSDQTKQSIHCATPDMNPMDINFMSTVFVFDVNFFVIHVLNG
jgi:hypothetical protein